MLPDVRRALADANIDAWLLYDFAEQSDRAMLGLHDSYRGAWHFFHPDIADRADTCDEQGPGLTGRANGTAAGAR
jgi:hypothetical protein